MIGIETNNKLQQYEQPSIEILSNTPQCYSVGSQLSRRSPAREAIILRTGTLQEQQEGNDNETLTYRLQQALEEKRILEIELEQIRIRLSLVRFLKII
jgi:hypothetical protein